MGGTALLDLSREQLAEALAPWIDRSYRVEQVYRALHERNARDLESITNLSRELRARLADHFETGALELAESRTAADGTRKLLYRLVDGATIEAVDIPDGGRRTFCISSQAGCALACRFCVTGYWGAGRNLRVGEIVGQVVGASEGLKKDDSTNIVFMGMGEPLLNLEGVAGALKRLTEWISWRRITVSTVGILPGIEAMASWQHRPNLAISLHAPDDARRSEIMPVNRRYPLADLMDCLRRYPLEKRRKLTFEYILIRGFNDSRSDADQLVDLLSGLRAKVNLIPVNEDPVLGPEMVPPEPDRIAAFDQRIRDRGLFSSVRRRRGDDVSAACGQLRAFGRNPRGFRRSRLSL